MDIFEDENWLTKIDGVDIKPCKANIDFGDTKRFKKLDCGNNAAMHISSLVQHMPAMAAIGSSNDIYVATFPAGVSHVLEKFKDGSGYYGAVRNQQTGRYEAQARFNRLGDYAVVAAVFTAMSVATSQYYLSAINSKLNTIQLGIDKILDFLYGEKSSELMAEVSFVKSAYENYSSIMAHQEQRQATIHSLQDAKKIAMKDLEFYISELNKKQTDKTEQYAQDAVRIKNCIELSEQLYVLSGVMEVYYSQNFDDNYISNVEREMTAYIDKAEKNILKGFGAVEKAVDKKEPVGVFKVLDRDKVGENTKQSVKDILEELTDGGESNLRKSIKDALHSFEQPVKIYIRSDGSAFMEHTS